MTSTYLPTLNWPIYSGWSAYTPVIPKVYWDVYSQEQRLKWLFCNTDKLLHYLDYIAELTNTWGVEFNKQTLQYVIDTINELDLQDEVNTKIETMIADGSFEAIIGDYIQANLFDDICYMHKVGILPYERSAIGYPGMQGGCLGDANNFIQYQIKSNIEYNRVSVISLDTGRVLRETTGQFGHGNSVSFHDDKIYITGGANDEFSNSIHILDYNTLEVLDRIENISYYSLVYMDAINSWVAMNGTWSYLNEKKLYILNDDFSVKEEKDYSKMNIGKTSAGMGVIGNYICVLTLEPSNILVFDRNLNYIRSIELNQNIDYMHYATEIEWIDGNNIDNVYVGVRLFGSPGRGGGNHLIAKTSLVDSYQGGVPTLSIVSRENVETIYVDEPDNWLWYEDGTSGKPFNNPYLASNAAQIKELQRIYINFKAQHTYDFELTLEDCVPKIFLRTTSNDAGDLVRFNNRLEVFNSEVYSNNIQWGVNVDTTFDSENYLANKKIIVIGFGTLTLHRSRYANTQMNIYLDEESKMYIGSGETVFNLIGSSIHGELTCLNRSIITGLFYDSIPNYSNYNNYFNIIKNCSDSITNNTNNLINMCVPTNVCTLFITFVNVNTNETAYVNLTLSPNHATGFTAININNHDLIVTGVVSTVSSNTEWTVYSITNLKVTRNGVDETNLWINKWCRLVVD